MYVEGKRENEEKKKEEKFTFHYTTIIEKKECNQLEYLSISARRVTSTK